MSGISGQVCLRRGETLAAGCCWIYDNEIDWADDTCEDGGLVEVLDSRMRYQGTGFFNRRSKITVRLVSRERGETIDRAFWERRIRAAWENRQALGFSNACRVIFGEPDGLPGLTVDKFGDCLSFQIVSLGMERMRDDILAILACSGRSAFMSATTLPCAKRRAWSSARAASTALSRRSSSSVSTTPSWP